MDISFETPDSFKRHLKDLADTWRLKRRMPPRQEILQTFQDLNRARRLSGIDGLFENPPLLLTATLDDGWGHGLEIIEACAVATGIQVVRLGLLIPPHMILTACSVHRADYVGLTMLQLDSEEALQDIGSNLPHRTRLIAGGPPFVIDPDLGSRCGVRIAARHVVDFLDFLLLECDSGGD